MIWRPVSVRVLPPPRGGSGSAPRAETRGVRMFGSVTRGRRTGAAFRPALPAVEPRRRGPDTRTPIPPWRRLGGLPPRAGEEFQPDAGRSCGGRVGEGRATKEAHRGQEPCNPTPSGGAPSSSGPWAIVWWPRGRGPGNERGAPRAGAVQPDSERGCAQTARRTEGRSRATRLRAGVRQVALDPGRSCGGRAGGGRATFQVHRGQRARNPTPSGGAPGDPTLGDRVMAAWARPGQRKGAPRAPAP